MNSIPLDAIPDLSDTQVIIYSRWDRSPESWRTRSTYPIVSGRAWARPKWKDVRGFRTRLLLRVIIFEDGTDLYGRARARWSTFEDPAADCRGRHDRDGAGRHRRGLGLSIRAGG